MSTTRMWPSRSASSRASAFYLAPERPPATLTNVMIPSPGGFQSMRKTLSGVMAAVVTSTVLTVLSQSTLPVAGQTAAYRAPRLADGKPDLNGIWQAMNEANYDLH